MTRTPPPRWTRDNRMLLALGTALGGALTGLYALALRARSLTPAAATNRILLFALLYVVVLLLLVLLFVLVRAAAKLLIESRKGVFGSRFRVRIVTTHVGLALLPIALLVLPTTGLLQRSVDFWFQPPVQDTMRAGRAVVDLVRERGAANERRAAARLEAGLGSARTDDERLALFGSVRETYSLDLVELRPEDEGVPALAVTSPRWPVREVRDPGPEWIADARARGLSRRIEPLSSGGQIARTLVPVPGGTLVLSSYDPPAEAASLRDLSRATSTYAMLEAERSSLEALQLLFFLLLAFLVLLAAVWAGLLLSRRVTRPIGQLVESARRVGEGDFEALVEVEGGDEIARLSGAFNEMTRELGRNRTSLVAANAEMKETNRRLDDERRRVRSILAHLDAGVLAFDAEGRLLAINEAALRLLDIPVEPPEGTPLGEVLSGEGLGKVRDFLGRAVQDRGPRETTLHLSARILEVRVARVAGVVSAASSGAGEAPEGRSFIVTLEDTTALVRAERAAAWEEAARRMAHEIKNPLTPIRLAAERMKRRARASLDPSRELAHVVDEGATTIVEEVGTLASLVDAFGRFARLPAAELVPTDLGAVVLQVVKLYAEVDPGVSVTAVLPPLLPVVKADPEQVKRALVNLVDNAVAATRPGGRVTVSVAVEGGKARLSVTDDGPGIPEADRQHIFDPAFSTKPRGTGLGLAITARIAAEHSGSVSVEENAPSGCRFVFEWPAA